VGEWVEVSENIGLWGGVSVRESRGEKERGGDIKPFKYYAK
jgi:hypothetical protein